MKFNASIKSGIVSGLLLSVSVQFWLLTFVYYELSDERFEVFTSPMLHTFGLLMTIVALGMMGFLAVRWAGQAVKGSRDGAISGAGAGATAGLIFYTLAGSLMVAYLYAVAPLLSRDEIAVLSESAWSEFVETVIGTYMQEAYFALVVSMLVGAVVGAMGGGLTVAIRDWRMRRAVGSAAISTISA